MLLKLNEISRLEDDGIRSQLRGRQARRDRRAQEVHRGVVGQAEELLLHWMGPWRRRQAGLHSGLRGLCLRLAVSLRSGSTQELKVLKKAVNRKVWVTLGT